MTDEQLEAAALKLCEIRGWPPGEYKPSYHYPLDTAADQAKREILSFYQVAQAVDSVLQNNLP